MVCCCCQGDETRNVKQFHFTAWPDHGVPTRAAPIIAFRRKVRSFDDSHPGKTIVHCRCVRARMRSGFQTHR